MQLLLKLPFILAQTHLGDPEKVSFVFALQASASMVSAFSYGRWAAYLRLSLVIPSGLILTSMGFVVAASATTFPVFAIAALITGSGAAISHAALFTWAMRSSPLDLAPHALGFVNTSLYLGDALSPIVFAPLFLLADLRLHLLILAAVIIAALVAVFIGRSICGSFGFGGVAKSGVTTD